MDMRRLTGGIEPASDEAVARIVAELGRARRADLVAVLAGVAVPGHGGSFDAAQAEAASSTEMTAPFTLGRKPSFNGGG